MLFNSIEYLIFLPIVVIAIDCIRNKDYQLSLLLIASYFFYLYSAGMFIFLMGVITIVSYIAGKKIFLATDLFYKKVWLSVSVIFTLMLLGYYKYFTFIVENLNSSFLLNIPLIEIILPIGISFYAFEAISYVVDIYRGDSSPANNLKTYALYISFFPHLVAGPIVLSRELIPQFESLLTIIPRNISYGSIRICWGFFKKIVIADNIAPIVGSILDNPTGQPSLQIILATFLFGIQIYCDFSGYCDIALGSARIMGIKLPENFQSPYFSLNPTDFWRRWHITLGRFILRYVYIPLGGNREGTVRTYFNLIVSMLLCGLWHGAAWHFILWGGFHGLCLAIHRIIQNILGFIKIRNHDYFWIISLLITQYFMFMGWIFFRVSGIDNISYCLNKYIFVDFIIFSPLLYIPVIISIVTVIVFISHKYPLKDFIDKFSTTQYFEKIPEMRVANQLIIILVLVFLIYLFAPGITPRFIYFQF